MKNNKNLLIGCAILLVLIIVIIVVALSFKKTDEIVVKANGGVSYNWDYTIKNKDIIEYKETESIEKRKNIVGGEIEEHFIFRGLKEGTTTIKLEYRNFVDNSVAKTKNYKATVNKKLEVDIKEIK